MLQRFRPLLLAVLACGTAALAQPFTPIGGNVSDGSGGPLLAGRVYHVINHLTVPAGTTLTVQPGAMVKFGNGIQMNVQGTLNAIGNETTPIWFTSVQDDDVGGDTNGNGPSSGTPGEWYGVLFHPDSDPSRFERVIVHYAGAGGWGAIELSRADVKVRWCTIEGSAGAAIDANSSWAGLSLPEVTACLLRNNGGVAVGDLALDAVPYFTNNSGGGNVGGNFLQITGPTITYDRTIVLANVMNGALVFTNHCTVPVGLRLTLEAGVVIKLQGGLQVTVNGTLVCNGNGGAHVGFTSYADDTLGGDTNRNGPSTGVPGEWYGIQFNQMADPSALTDVIVRNAGAGGWAGVELAGADIALTRCEIDRCAGNGLDLNASFAGTARPTVTICTFRNNGGVAVADMALDSMPGFLDNAGIGNAGGNYQKITVPNPTSDLTLDYRSLISAMLVLANHLTVPQGITLTVPRAVVVKLIGGLQVTVNGTLVAGGGGAPVVFTSYTDDEYGGDTNVDGPSSGTPGQWYGITFNPFSDASMLDRVFVRYAGAGGWAGLELAASDALLTGCLVEWCAGSALDLNSSFAGTSFATVRQCTFRDNAGVAVQDAALDQVPGFSSNAASGNAGGDYMRVTVPGPTADRTIALANVLNDVLVLTNHLTVPAGFTLTLQAGLAVKMQGGLQLTMNGTLRAPGTSGAPVVFTSYADDDYGGDTNKNGPSSGTPGEWYGIHLTQAADASLLDHVIVRHAGAGGWGGLELNGADATVAACLIERCASAGIDCNSSFTPTSFASVRGCTIRDNAGLALADVAVDQLPGFTGNAASGNAGGNYAQVSGPSPTADRVIGPSNYPGGALVFTNHCTVPAGITLTLRDGVIVKMRGGLQVQVNGALRALGTGAQPVVFTSFADDAFGGDTNGNGPSTGVRGEWYGVQLAPASGASLLEHVRLRWVGAGGWFGLHALTPQATVRSVRVEHSASSGIQAGAHAGTQAENWVAFDCAGHGIELTAGSFALVHATAAGNGASGVRRTGTQSGLVVSTISWGNGTNFDGFAAGQVFNSNGSAALAGQNGNLNVDPQFVDATPAVGDLRLAGASPMINAADVARAVAAVKDHEENSRLLDSTLTGAMLPDMGAYERAAWTMAASGQPVLGTTLTFTVGGPAGVSVYALGLLEGSVLLPPYGFLTVGLAPVLLVTLPVGVPFPLGVPGEPSLSGLVVGVQTITFPQATTTVGNLTSLYRATLRP
jgi:hypothetical protein